MHGSINKEGQQQALVNSDDTIEGLNIGNPIVIDKVVYKTSHSADGPFFNIY